jgi:hypothetical protein
MEWHAAWTDPFSSYLSLFAPLVTEAFLLTHLKEHGSFPPKIAAFLSGWQPPEPL